eukprot:73609_1
MTLNHGKSIKQTLHLWFQHCTKSHSIQIKKCMEFIPAISKCYPYLTKSESKRFSMSLCQVISSCNNPVHLTQIHALIEPTMLSHNMHITTTLIKSYAKHSQLTEAMNIYHTMDDSLKDIHIIRAIMKALINNAQFDTALSIYHDSSHFKDDSLHILAIQACAKSNTFDEGKQIIATNAMHSKTKSNHMHLKTSLIDFYGTCGDIHEAIRTFNSIKHHQMNVCIVGAMMKAYINNGYFIECLRLYDNYHVLHDDLCHLLAIKACWKSNDLAKGKHIHSIIHSRLANSAHTIEISNALIEFYGHFKDVQNAYKVMSALSPKQQQLNVIFIPFMKILIANHCNINTDTCVLYIHHALDIFGSMDDAHKTSFMVGTIMTVLIDAERYEKALCVYEQYEWLHDDVCHNLAIKACVHSNNINKGKQIRDALGTDIDNIQLKNGLISFYGHFCDIENAQSMYHSMEDRDKDIVSVSAMMDAYYNAGMLDECMQLFRHMSLLNNKLRPDVISYVIMLKACTQATAYHFGCDIHRQLEENELLNHVDIQTHLIRMYGKCGMLSQCQQIFERSNHKSKVDIWNAMMYSFGRNGDIQTASEWYQQMIGMGLTADMETYKILLNGCSHCGDVTKAKLIWEGIKDDDVKYNPVIINTLADCMARKGFVVEAKQLILKFNEKDETAWTSLLHGCVSNGIDTI